MSEIPMFDEFGARLNQLLRENNELRLLLDLRPEVLSFAHLMERELRNNDHKPGWKHDSAQSLFSHLHAETRELKAWLDFANPDPAHISEETADVANMAMMVADVCGALPRVPDTRNFLAAHDAAIRGPLEEEPQP